MRLGYVVLYVEQPEACRLFWVDKLDAEVLESNDVGGHTITKIGLPDGGAALELVPRALMRDNPDGLDLATPSVCFYVADATSRHATLADRGVLVAPIRDHFGKQSFAFQDNEGRWFAVMQA